MNSICLSVAPNLRCQDLTRLENIVLLIPPAIELVFSLTLAFTDASVRGRKRWLLVLDGVSFFLLALADLLAHLLTEAASTVSLFKIIDFVVAGASFLPILSYTLFLFLYARSNLVKLLPTRFCRVISFSLFAVIPPIIAFNELGSLLGISHKVDRSTNGTPILKVGFSNLTFQRLSLFFSSGTLALLTLFQAALFTLCFIRLVRAFLDERRVEDSRADPEAPEEIHLFRGLGWLAAGLKLGAIESVVGFANVSFSVAVTRRVIRLFGRGAVIIGVIKGLNIVEDFVKFESDVKARRGGSRRSKRFSRFMISNPRNSTFQQLSPQASNFHAAQREKKAGRVGPSPLALGADSTLNAFDRSTSRRRERVTVQYDGKTPPVLEMRFSTLDIEVPPLPQKISPSTQKASLSVVMEDPREDQQSTRETIFPAQVFEPPRKPPLPQYNIAPASTSSNSLPTTLPTATDSRRTISVVSDTMEEVRQITAKFPGIPSRVMPDRSLLAQPGSTSNQDLDPDSNWLAAARSRELHRPPQSQEENETRMTLQSSTPSPRSPINRQSTPTIQTRDQPLSNPIPTANEYVQRPEQTTSPASYYSSDDDSEDDGEDDYSTRTTRTTTYDETPDLTRVSTLETSPATPAMHGMPFIHPAERPAGRLATRVMAIEGKMARAKQSEVGVGVEASEERRRQRLSQLRRELRAPSADEQAYERNGHELDGKRGRGSVLQEQEQEQEQEIEIPWLHNDPLTELQTIGGVGIDMDEDEDMVLDEAWRRAGLTRIKSVSQVRVHTTPRAEQTFDVRGSLFAVEEEDDIEFSVSPEQERNPSMLRRPARLDSGVLGEEDKRLVQQGLYN